MSKKEKKILIIAISIYILISLVGVIVTEYKQRDNGKYCRGWTGFITVCSK